MGLDKLYKVSFWLSILGLVVFILDFGYNQPIHLQHKINVVYFVVILVGISTTCLRYFKNFNKIRKKVFAFDLISVAFSVIVILLHFSSFFPHLGDESFLYDDIWLKLAIFFTFIREFSEQKINFKRTFLNPAQLFILSFLGVIVLGSLLLMLPNATYEGLDMIDALFTSTSAVCVTGLIVVDTGSFFTPFGQFIILILIQIGGLGILTFASYFSYFFKGGTTYENQLTISEMTNSQKLGEVFNLLKYIILITVFIESLSAVMIFFSVKSSAFETFGERLFFSIFHSISAFCNAGFSTLPNSLYETGFRFNYGLQLILIGTFVMGGLGFPIVVNILKYFKHSISLFLFGKRQSRNHRPWVLNLNSRITLITTLSLMLVGFVSFFFFEYNHTLADRSFFGKIVTALFGATTPRTAGFNSIDMNALAFPTIMITFLLMWIGASPASTGGGIKTSTFAIATLNILSLGKGKSRIEVFRREIADISVKRAFATISLSLIVIGLGIIVITEFNPELGLMNIAFECFSAYSTVGLSLGITSSLSGVSKVAIIAIMFIGRVSMLSIIIAFFKKVKHKNYRYPTEEILIN